MSTTRCQVSEDVDGGRKWRAERKAKRRTSSRCARGSHQSMSNTHVHVAAHGVTHWVKDPSDGASVSVSCRARRTSAVTSPVTSVSSPPVTSPHSRTHAHSRARARSGTRLTTPPLMSGSGHSTLTGSSGPVANCRDPRAGGTLRQQQSCLLTSGETHSWGKKRGINKEN